MPATASTGHDRPYRKEMDYFEGRAGGLQSVVVAGLPAAVEQARAFHPRFADGAVPLDEFTLDDARLVVARQHGCDDWAELGAYIGELASGSRQEPMADAHDALEARDPTQLSEILRQHPEIVNARGTNGNTLLGLAASINPECDPHLADQMAGEGRDARFPLVRTLLDAGADVHAANDRGWTVLHQAGYSGSVGLIDMLLAAGARVDAEAHGDGGTPLMMALFWGHRAAAERLAEVAVVPANLRAAAGLGRMDLLESLVREDGTLALEAGAHRAFYRPHSGFPVWHPSYDPAEILNEALVYAAKSGRAEAIGFLLDRGAAVNAEPYNGTALHWAAAQGKVDAVHILLERGADVNSISAFGGVVGITPLHAAAWAGKMETVKALVEAGADLARPDPTYHGFPFGWANHNGHPEVRDYLLEVGSHTDIFHAIAAGRADRVSALLDADPGLANRDEGWAFPLTDAIERGQTEIVDLLLERGADPDLADPQGRTGRTMSGP